MTRLLFAITLSVLPSLSWAAFSSAAKGTSAAGFLKLGAGARAAGLGGAYSALADEAGALYWNPAGLTRVVKRSAVFMHAAHLDASQYEYLAYAQRLAPGAAWGLGIQYFEAGRITETNISGSRIGDFTPHDLALSAGYAHRLREEDVHPALAGYALGYSAKFVRSTIVNSAQTWALDLGLLSPPYLGGRLRGSFTAANLGGKLRFDKEREELPLALRLGAAYELKKDWHAAADVALPRDNIPGLALGTEKVTSLSGEWKFAGRFGFETRTLGDVNGLTGVSFGVGLKHDRASFDYAFLAYGAVGMTHRLSVSYGF